MRRACCHPRASRGVGFLIEIIVVAVLIIGGFAMYLTMTKGSQSATERALNDPTGTTTAIGLQNQLQAGEGREPYGRPAEGMTTVTTGQPPTPGAAAPTPDGSAAPTPGATVAPSSTPRTYVRQPQSIPGRAVYKARGEQCQENIRQMRMLIQMNTDENGGVFPKSLTDVPDSIKVRSCPVGGQDYVYDPATGRLYCNTPGHENF